MLRNAAVILTFLILTLANSSEVQAQYEIRLSSGYRVGGSFVNSGYSSNSFLDDLDIASGPQFGGSFYYHRRTPLNVENTIMYGVSINFQRSDLRFKPANISEIPDSILEKYEVDGDKLILGEINVTYFHVGILYKFGSSSSWDPHLNFGIGATIFKAEDGDLKETELSFTFGAGVTKMFSESIGTQIKLTSYLTSLPSDVYWLGNNGGTFRSINNTMFFQGAISGGLVFAF